MATGRRARPGSDGPAAFALRVSPAPVTASSVDIRGGVPGPAPPGRDRRGRRRRSRGFDGSAV